MAEYALGTRDATSELAYVVDIIHSKGNKFVMDVKIKVTGDSKLNDSSIGCCVSSKN